VTTPARPRYLADRYRLEEVLGRGATGTVWAAYDEMLRRRVAVKEVPPPPGMPEPEAHALRERTLREARSIAVLSHPNVVTLYDVVRQDGEPFVVMELLPAQSLAKVINERGPLDIGGAALVGHAVASALQAAHDSGITHRDVKPGNVLIGSGAANGRIKLTDFGIARNVAESTMTVTGMTLGSPAFIAPEVASGGQVTPAADLWGLGATLFAAVQGHPPYDAGDPLATVAAVVTGEVPQPTAAGPLAPVITGLMVKDPARRLPLSEVRRLLQPLLPPDGRVLRDAANTAVLAVPANDERTGSVPHDQHDQHDQRGQHGTTSMPHDQRDQRAAPVHDEPTSGLGWPPPAVAALTSPLAPLATDPGPLPFTATRPRRHRRSGLATAAIALASVLFFAFGAVGGFEISRWAAGAPPLPSAARTAPGSAPGGAAGETGLHLHDVAVTNDRPGGDEALLSRFTVGVPEGWAAYRPPLSSAETPIVATFVAPEGNRSISVDHLRGFYPKGDIEEYLERLQETMSKSVDEVVPQPVNPVGPPASAGAPESPHETSFRTVERGSGGTSDELLRTTLVYLLPTATDLWVLKVTVPTDQQKAADELYDEVKASFRPSIP